MCVILRDRRERQRILITKTEQLKNNTQDNTVTEKSL